MSLYVLLLRLRMLQTQTTETLSAATDRQVLLSTEGQSIEVPESVHENIVLQSIYNRKPVQGVQDWCYMFSFMSASD